MALLFIVLVNFLPWWVRGIALRKREARCFFDRVFFLGGRRFMVNQEAGCIQVIQHRSLFLSMILITMILLFPASLAELASPRQSC